MIVDPITIDPEENIAAARALMSRYRISGVPVTKGGKLVGIPQPNRDLRFGNPLRRAHFRSHEPKRIWSRFPWAPRSNRPKAMLPPSTAWKNCWWWTNHYNLKGLITVKDIQKK